MDNDMELPAPELRNLENIAKVSWAGQRSSRVYRGRNTPGRGAARRTVLEKAWALLLARRCSRMCRPSTGTG